MIKLMKIKLYPPGGQSCVRDGFVAVSVSIISSSLLKNH